MCKCNAGYFGQLCDVSIINVESEILPLGS